VNYGKGWYCGPSVATDPITSIERCDSNLTVSPGRTILANGVIDGNEYVVTHADGRSVILIISAEADVFYTGKYYLLYFGRRVDKRDASLADMLLKDLTSDPLA